MASKWDKYKVSNPSSKWEQYKVNAPKNDYQKNENESFLNKILGSLQPFVAERGRESSAQNAFNIGGAQGAINAPVNLANLLPGVNLPTANLKGHVPIKNAATEGLFGAGEIAGGLLPGAGVYGGLSKIPGLGGNNVLQTALKSGLTEYGISPDEDRLKNSLVAALLPLGLQAKSLPKNIMELPEKIKGLTNKSIGNKIINDFKHIQGNFNNEYEGFLNKAEELGVHNIPINISSTEIRKFGRIADEKYVHTLKDLMKDKSIRNSHKAQSMLRAFIDSYKNKKLVPSERDAVNAAIKMRRNIKQNMYKELTKKGGLEMPFKYSDITRRYREEMAPFMNTKAIRNALLKPGEEGYIFPEQLPHELYLKSNGAFRSGLGHNYPELKVNRLLAGPLGKGALGIGSLAGLAKIYKSFEQGGQ